MAYGASAFDSLFPSPSILAPTPIATPAIGFVQDGESFGAQLENLLPEFGVGTAQARRLLAFSTARGFLSNITVISDSLSTEGVQNAHSTLKTKESSEVLEAMKVLLEDWPDNHFQEEDLVSTRVESIRFPSKLS
jgi:hypothetical protein